MNTSSKRLLQTALVAAFVAGGLSAQAIVLTTAPQVFNFSGDLDLAQSGSIAAFNQAGTLLGVHIELSGSTAFTLTATSKPAKSGTINSMTEATQFDLSGLPFASLSTSTPLFSVPSFNLAANSSQSFNGTGLAPLTSIDIGTLLQLDAYNVASGAPALLPFSFTASETFDYSKSGSGLAAGSDVSALAEVKVWYSYELTTPPPVPEVSTAVSAGAFALVGGLVLLRTRKTQVA